MDKERIIKKFMSHVSFLTECWHWDGMVDTHKVCKFYYPPAKRTITAKRVSCILFKNAKENFFDYISLCKNSLCVNPEHLAFFQFEYDKFRYFVNCDTANGCFEWNGYIDPHGYGKFNGKPVHRYVYELFNEPIIPSSLNVMHSCDNRKCVNISHLSLGTMRDNMLDMFQKNRQQNYILSANKRRGLNSKRTVLKLSDLDKIKILHKELKSSRKIAKIFNVNKSTILEVLNDEYTLQVNT